MVRRACDASRRFRFSEEISRVFMEGRLETWQEAPRASKR